MQSRLPAALQLGLPNRNQLHQLSNQSLQGPSFLKRDAENNVAQVTAPAPKLQGSEHEQGKEATCGIAELTPKRSCCGMTQRRSCAPGAKGSQQELFSRSNV